MAVIAAVRVLAHQGGWDEILFVLAPLLVFAGLLAVARRRVDDPDQDDPLEGRVDTGTESTGHPDPT